MELLRELWQFLKSEKNYGLSYNNNNVYFWWFINTAEGSVVAHSFTHYSDTININVYFGPISFLS